MAVLPFAMPLDQASGYTFVSAFVLTESSNGHPNEQGRIQSGMKSGGSSDRNDDILSPFVAYICMRGIRNPASIEVKSCQSLDTAILSASHLA